jgi:hypothetical protein
MAIARSFHVHFGERRGQFTLRALVAGMAKPMPMMPPVWDRICDEMPINTMVVVCQRRRQAIDLKKQR